LDSLFGGTFGLYKYIFLLSTYIALTIQLFIKAHTRF
jgi:hypothetical protein